ncbi:hypothetical protein Ae201684P_001249 [Aphanomyces euteiches]|nr:hypothetical protein Ae201684P_001249 [Aphanomyces euteiches]KAH9149046.1 hypothetical protein AeRB84_007742 [Aphanomyces euteiches]KAH9149075.1 hypothetical protein AeRB84_007771 [Aphanomyces euteiches]KAH9152048.1 hypothetical protein AeRB84_005471 [Aphanomyces euteiches]
MKAAIVRCKQGCGDFGVAELDYLCVDCDTRMRLHQVTALQPVPSVKTTTTQRRSGQEGTNDMCYGVIYTRIEWRAFLNLQREQNKSIVEQEVQMFQEKSATERQVQAKLKHYMVASNDQQDVDKSLWTSMSPKF